MAKQIINNGTFDNDPSAEKIRISFDKAKANFDELYDSVDDIYTYLNKILSFGGISLLGQDITVGASSWKIGLNTFSTLADTVINIPFADTGLLRIDAIVFNDAGQIVAKTGIESVTPVEPTILNNEILITNILVSDSSVSNPTLPAEDETASHYRGKYNATTNNPVLVNGVGQNGDYYKVTVGGTQDFGAGDIVMKPNDILHYFADDGYWDLLADNNQTPEIKRTFICNFVINQNVSASPTGNTQWFRRDSAQGNNITGNFTLQTSLDVSTNFATHTVFSPCYSLPFQAKIKSVHARGWTNTANTTGVDFVVLKAKETSPNIASGVTTISNGLIIARETVQIYAVGFPNGFVKEFASGSLNTTTLPKDSDIRLVFKNFNLASNMFDTVITVEFEEVL